MLAALQIARALRKHRARVTAFVPHHAMSAGTRIAPAAGEIVVDEHAVLGPVDPQLGDYPAASVVRVVETKPPAEVDDRTLILAGVAQKAIAQVRRHVEDLLQGRYEPEAAREIARILSEGTWTHDHPITFEEAQALGLHVRSGVPQEIYQLMALYPQPVRQTASVEYLPVPRRGQRTG